MNGNSWYMSSIKPSIAWINSTFIINKDLIIYPNSQREITNLGLTNKNSKGSLFIIFNVEFPSMLNDKQKEDLEKIL